jgi:hypothetical protein
MKLYLCQDTLVPGTCGAKYTPHLVHHTRQGTRYTSTRYSYTRYTGMVLQTRNLLVGSYNELLNCVSLN